MTPNRYDHVKMHIPDDGDSFDVIVAGGGPAGLGAAAAAALQGARTLLLESRGYLGGTAATALWMPMNRVTTADRPRGGVHDLLLAKMKSLGSSAWREGKRNKIDGDGFDFHPDYLRLGALEMIEETGCNYRFYSPVTGVNLSGSSVHGIETKYKAITAQFDAGVVVDATGDGDVADLAGAEMVNGREEDGGHMPISLIFAIGGADTDRVGNYTSDDRELLRKAIDEARNEGLQTAAWTAFDVATIPGVVSVNNGGIYDVGFLDGNDPSQRTLVERLGIRVAVDFVTIAHRWRLPGLEQCHLARVGQEVSVRDTRRIVGEYVLTLDDAENAPDFPDIVARKYGAVDANQLYIGKMASGFGYPYRCMLPKAVDGLLAAGRCGSATFLGHAAGKSMGNMMALGQAAGVAAAWCAKRGVEPRNADVRAIQALLREMGVNL
jgi:hypothetical protein